MVILKPSPIDEIIIKTELNTKHEMRVEVIEQLLDSNRGIVVKGLKGELAGFCLFSLHMADKITETIARIYALEFNSEEAKNLLLSFVKNRVDNVLVSCIAQTSLGFSETCEWEDLENLELCDSEEHEEDISSLLNSNGANIMTVANEFCANIGDNFDFQASEEAQLLRDSLYSNIVEVVPGVYRMSVIGSDYTNRICEYMDGVSFEVNTEEQIAYQLPECVLEYNNQELYVEAVSLFNNFFKKVATMLYHRKDYSIQTAQLARYSKELGISEGNWHYDKDSDLTVVTYLNDGYTGGGISIKPFGNSKVVEINDLKRGDVLIFNGHMTPHKGNPVTSGNRDLLVYWCKGV